MKTLRNGLGKVSKRPEAVLERQKDNQEQPRNSLVETPKPCKTIRIGLGQKDSADHPREDVTEHTLRV